MSRERARASLVFFPVEKHKGRNGMAKVMVVDDAAADLKLMQTILESGGHQVISCQEGALLEDKVAAEQPTVLLLDLVMPTRNGYEVLRGLRKDVRTKGTRVIIVSSKNTETDIAWGKKQGADDYLPKPFTQEQLLAVVGRWAR
jgi:twitching motility two-component system response regulator PilH